MQTWYVATPTGPVSVLADFALTDGGALEFYKINPTGGPDILAKAFAAGQWTEVTKAA